MGGDLNAQNPTLYILYGAGGLVATSYFNVRGTLSFQKYEYEFSWNEKSMIPWRMKNPTEVLLKLIIHPFDEE